MTRNMRESERFFTHAEPSCVKRARVATGRGRVSETVPFVSQERPPARPSQSPDLAPNNKNWKKMRVELNAVVVVTPTQTRASKHNTTCTEVNPPRISLDRTDRGSRSIDRTRERPHTRWSLFATPAQNAVTHPMSWQLRQDDTASSLRHPEDVNFRQEPTKVIGREAELIPPPEARHTRHQHRNTAKRPRARNRTQRPRDPASSSTAPSCLRIAETFSQIVHCARLQVSVCLLPQGASGF